MLRDGVMPAPVWTGAAVAVAFAGTEPFTEDVGPTAL